MKKIVLASVLCALFSVATVFFFVTQTFIRLPLGPSLGCAFLLTAAADAAALSLVGRKRPEGRRKQPESGQETVRGKPSGSDGRERNRGYEVFQRIVSYMEERKPYLDESLNLEDFSKSIFTNKVYVSKNINHYSGKNFRQFVNWYRIQYALDLMKRDPHLKMEEVSVMSGFHTTVSFNMAFRLFEGKTPTEWHDAYVDSLRKR